jgi:hypothetical protein
MAEGLRDRVARARGSLSLRGLRARGLEAAARNPSCRRLQILTLTGVTPAVALAEIYGDRPEEGQSPFAIGTGNRFERELFDQGAARLIRVYREQGRLGDGEDRVVDVARRILGSRPADFTRRRELTRDFLRFKLLGDPAAPHLILKPRLLIAFAGLRYEIEPDALIAAGSDPFYRPIEIKSYPDRAGKTNLADIRSACRQAAVEVIGLRQAAAGLGVADPDRLAPAQADLILRRPGSMQPMLRSMALRGEIDSIERFLAGAEADLAELLALVPEGRTLADPGVLDAIPNRYHEACREHCALVDRCKREALALGDPIVLGSRAREELAAAGSIGRVYELIDGRGDPPRTPEERDLGRRLMEARAAYYTAIGHA